MGYRETIINKYFDQSVEEFDGNPVAAEFLRRLAKESPALFVPSAIKRLLSDENSNVDQFLLSLAVRQEALHALLADPDTASLEAAQKLFKKFLDLDPGFDVTMARRLPNRARTNQSEALDGRRCTRALDILDIHSHGRRLLPILSHLPDAADERVAAKATLFIGKRMQNPTWAAHLLERADSRVRASAVESLWGMNTPVAIQLMESCAADRNNRVMGNALVGLHIAGRQGVEDVLLSLSHSGLPGRRQMVEWAMGKIAK